ncbi:MAG: DEAD/DEAH box helicase [Desulfobacteraceae bacterium]|nr:DEAD/DEAH box helicase [Desulfobacteraceae bacterium]MBC2748836.1 DEAD/DEAH box helicase [Desulfobacteraceae bacterium]
MEKNSTLFNCSRELEAFPQTPAIQLRDYQLDIVKRARRSVYFGRRRLLIVLPTGGGKTIVAVKICAGAIEKGNTVLFLVHRRELAYQARERFEAFGLGHEVGLIMAGEKSNLGRPIQIATIQTYIRRIALDDPQFNVWFHRASVVVVDEAHHAIAPSYTSVLDLYMDKAVVLGLTATPCRSDGRGLGELYEEIVQGAGIVELTREGYLVPMVYYAPHRPELQKIKIVAGDYDKKQLGAVMDRPKLVGDIFENWARIAPERQTIVFATNVKHSRNIQEVFKRRSVAVEHLDAHTPKDERAATLGRLRRGETQVITNVGILTEGFDYPGASCIVIARPTKSWGLYLQMAGRGLRTYPGKTDCILIDHSGCIANHGFIDDPVAWTLNGKKQAWNKSDRSKADKIILTCEMCCAAFTGPRCPICGTEVRQYSKKIAAIQADLVKVKGLKRAPTVEEKRRFFGMLECHREQKGYAPGWTAHKYQEKFGAWPRGMEDAPQVEPDRGFRNWLTHLNIKYAYAKRRTSEARHA